MRPHNHFSANGTYGFHFMEFLVFQCILSVYSLRGGECLSVPRFETRFMKDSLAYRGTVLWNTICLNENGIAHLSKKDRNLIRTKDYFKDFKFDTTSASTTRRRNADFIYN